jgi:glucose-6-phosphate 1-dehydrogenase
VPTREPAAIYLALPPAVFATTIESLAGRSESLPAYAHVLQDILTGGSARSVGGAEAEEARRVVASIVAGPWSEGRSDE